MEASWRDDHGDSFSLDYRYLREIPRFFGAFPKQNDRYGGFSEEFDSINQISGRLRIAITRQWRVTYRAAYSLEQSTLLGNEGDAFKIAMQTFYVNNRTILPLITTNGIIFTAGL